MARSRHHKDVMSQREYIGFHSIDEIRNILVAHKPKKIFLITGRSSYDKCGARQALEPILRLYPTIYFSPAGENPGAEDIKRGIEILSRQNCDFVIAVGGGSIIDLAKAINILSLNSGRLEDYLGRRKELSHRGRPLAAVPTTAGTGSESTRFAVVYIEKTKYSLEHDFMLPDYAIVDPQLTLSLPRYITASTGMDALAQAIESYWSIHSDEISKSYAKEAIKLSVKALPDVCNSPSAESREVMMRAAHLAGKAINLSKTTACHAISYPITSYFGVSHGHAVALTLGEMMVYNYDACEEDLLDKRGRVYVRRTLEELCAFLGAGDAAQADRKINRLMVTIGLQPKLSRLGIKTGEQIETIVKSGVSSERINNNPRKLTEQSVRTMLQKIL